MRSRILHSWRAIAWTLLLALLPLLTACAPGGATTGHLARLATATPFPGAAATPTPCDPATQWKAPAGNVSLEAFAMVSPVEGWASGSLTTIPGEGEPAGVLYHLVNGQWRRLPQTYPGADLTVLSMDSPSDGWAASPYPITGSAHPLVLHYTGGVWQPVDVPALDAVLAPTATTYGANINTLSVQMFGPHAGWMFVWTNRDSNNEGGPMSLVLRLENDQWTLVPGPSIAASVRLFNLSAVSADEAWMVGTEYQSTAQTTLFYHYSHGGWSRSPQTFPTDSGSLTMLSPTDGWAVEGDPSPGLFHYDGVRWTMYKPPAPWAAQHVSALGPVFAIAPNVTWFVTGRPDGLGIWQDAAGHWSQIAWPYQDSIPFALAVSDANDVWGAADIFHQLGCAPAMVTETLQGVFLHEVNGQWTRQMLP